MKFLVDAHLPRRLAYRLRDVGHDVVHTRDLPRGNRTPDDEIIEIAVREQRIVVTKDADFMNSFWVARQPPKLLLVSTGNITNADLEALFLRWIEVLPKLFTGNDFLELTRNRLLVHE
jgi:predicted nuclease of predicted toxin-antitoxin system